MRSVLSWVLLLCLAIGALPAFGQKVRFKESGLRLERIDASDFQEETTEVSGQGHEVPGLDLGDQGKPRHRNGEDTTHAAGALMDVALLNLGLTRNSIHTGPVVAGIVGVKKFQYDIWGDTVNTASRMRLRPDLSGESSGEVGQVNISEATYALVKSEAGLTFTPRGKVQAKGKGEMEMYFVEGKSAVAKGYGG